MLVGDCLLRLLASCLRHNKISISIGYNHAEPLVSLHDRPLAQRYGEF
jgi:hypothetical protein